MIMGYRNEGIFQLSRTITWLFAYFLWCAVVKRIWASHPVPSNSVTLEIAHKIMLTGLWVRIFPRFWAWGRKRCSEITYCYRTWWNDRLIISSSSPFTPFVNTCVADMCVHIEGHLWWTGIRECYARCEVTCVISCTVCEVRHSYASSTWYIHCRTPLGMK